MSVRILQGDVREILRTLPDESVHCVVTSPPYWGLRDYGTAQWAVQRKDDPDPQWYVCEECGGVEHFSKLTSGCPKCGKTMVPWEGGDPGCDHLIARENNRMMLGSDGKLGKNCTSWTHRDATPPRQCKCGARRIDSQLGLEPTLAEHVETMVGVFREVRRVLRRDGTCWINYGSSYASGGMNPSQSPLLWRARAPCDALASTIPASSGCAQDASSQVDTASASRPAPLTSLFDEQQSAHTRLCNRGTFSPQPALALRTKGNESFFSACGKSDCNGIGRCGVCWTYLAIPALICKPKDEINTPHLVAMALQADGWFLRQTIVWAKSNPMPESVTDRCTKAHEYLFLLSKSANYFYDAEAIREDVTGNTHAKASKEKLEEIRLAREHGANSSFGTGYKGPKNHAFDGKVKQNESYHNAVCLPVSARNRRTVWEIATAPFPEAHFATFPPALVEPCIKAGTSERGCCGKCGAPWVRKTKSEFVKLADRRPTRKAAQDGADMADINSHNKMGYNEVKTIGWSPSCLCYADLHQAKQELVPATVLDPFGGAGTTGLVADRLGRNAILIELNPAYAAMARKRLTDDCPLFMEAAE